MLATFPSRRKRALCIRHSNNFSLTENTMKGWNNCSRQRRSSLPSIKSSELSFTLRLPPLDGCEFISWTGCTRTTHRKSCSSTAEAKAFSLPHIHLLVRSFSVGPSSLDLTYCIIRSCQSSGRPHHRLPRCKVQGRLSTDHPSVACLPWMRSCRLEREHRATEAEYYREWTAALLVMMVD